ncbi:MAG: FAD-binding oxidoreductase [Candidatus Brocadiae bacterium]|nr:FAD-binding oxidoreductase [Candidatus Brocadiia bacterium]
METYDVIVIGAGSIGAPSAYFLAQRGLKVLCLEQLPSSGQGQNKAAIGGVRATHSDPAKIKICQKSLEIFSGWKELTGTDIGWKKGGYCFPVYEDREEKILKGLLPIQKKYNLNIDWIDDSRIKEVIPGINPEKLRGGTLSPEDGQVSPLKAINSFVHEAQKKGTKFLFQSKVTALKTDSQGCIVSVETQKEKYSAGIVLNAAGADASEICKMVGLDIPVFPDCHEAGISAPIAPFLDPLVVDLRPGAEGKTSNFYFGQNSEGQIIFCYTPNPPILGTNRHSTSEFMPIIARRLVDLIPRFKNLTIRRVWRGLYPMTPDGVAIVGKAPGLSNLYLGIGMCGQGFMMGPGVGANLASLINQGKSLMEDEVFTLLSPSRNFYAKKEVLK